MNKGVSDFLDRVCEEIKYKSVQGGISEELESHVNELIDYYCEAGFSEDEASIKAVEQMGDPVKIGQDLNKTHRPKTEWSIIALIGVMVMLGVISQVTFINDPASFSYLSIQGLFKTYLSYIFISIIVFLTTFFSDYKRIEKHSLHIAIGALIFVLLGQLLFGRIILGHSRIALQVISIAVPFLIVSFVGLIRRWCNGNIKDMAKLLGLVGVAMALFLAFTSALTITAGLLITFLITITTTIANKDFKGNRVKWLVILYGSGIAGLLLTVDLVLKPWQLDRLKSVFHPEAYSTGYGWITLLIRRDLLPSATLWGQSGSLHHSFQGVDRLILPSANTDLVFIYMISTFGWVMGIAVILVVITAICRMFLATRKIKDQYGKFLSISIVSIFSIQAISNIFMNLGIFPGVSVSLPFISFGGTSFVVNMALIGLLLSVYRRKDLILVANSGI